MVVFLNNHKNNIMYIISKNKNNALGMGLAVTLVITLSSIICYFVYRFLLIKFDMIYMKTIIFILIIATFVQIMEMVIKKRFPSLHKSLGIYLPLITTNCAVLGVATISSNYSFFHMLVYSFASGIGFLIVLYVFSSIRQKLSLSPVPKSFKDIPIALITASVLAMIIFRFSGV